MVHYYVASPGILGIKSNLDSLSWSWGTVMPYADEMDYEGCRVKLDYQVHATVEPKQPLEELHKFHYFSGAFGDDSLYYSRTLLGGRKLQLRIDGIAEGKPTMMVNADYHRFVQHRFMNLHSAGYILTDIAALSLLRAGYAPLHCSAFTSSAATYVVLAAPNTGKTLTTMQACLDYGAGFIAEDLAITDGEVVFSVPWTSTFRYYETIDQRRTSRWRNAATTVMPALELIPGKKTRKQRISSFVPPERMIDRSHVTDVILLERGNTGVRDESPIEAQRKARVLNRYEFNFLKAPALVAYSYFNAAIDLDQADAKENEILSSLVAKAPRVRVVSAQDATKYTSMLLAVEG